MSTTMTTASPGAPTSTAQLRKKRLVAVAAASLAPLAVWAVVEGGFGTDLRAPASGNGPPTDIGWAAVVAAAAVASLAAWGLLGVLERFTRRARIVWAAVAVVVLVMSLAGALGGTGITTGNRMILVLMHVVVAAVLIPLLYRTSPSGQSAPAA